MGMEQSLNTIKKRKPNSKPALLKSKKGIKTSPMTLVNVSHDPDRVGSPKLSDPMKSFRDVRSQSHTSTSSRRSLSSGFSSLPGQRPRPSWCEVKVTTAIQRGASQGITTGGTHESLYLSSFGKRYSLK